MFEDAIILKY